MCITHYVHKSLLLATADSLRWTSWISLVMSRWGLKLTGDTLWRCGTTSWTHSERGKFNTQLDRAPFCAHQLWTWSSGSGSSAINTTNGELCFLSSWIVWASLVIINVFSFAHFSHSWRAWSLYELWWNLPACMQHIQDSGELNAGHKWSKSLHKDSCG